MLKTISHYFEKLFSSRGRFFCAPGRINLIGEHTDYNDCFVLPASITDSIYGMIQKNYSDTVKLYSIDYSQYLEFKIGAGKPDEQWAKYIYGVIELMRQRGKNPHGFNCVFGGNIPVGAGLSSSAALENLFSFSINSIFDLGFSELDLVKIGQQCEHEYIGVKCGIMDQFVSMFGKKESALLLDCRSLTYKYKPFNPQGYCLVLIDTRVKHSLAASEYNQRRDDCEKGVEILSKINPNIKSLRDLSLDFLHEHKDELCETTYKRCKYVIEENSRVLSACEALDKGDYEKFGKLMYDSHNGLKTLYNVSCPELDTLVDAASEIPGVIGARMMGGGFGGCTINLVKKDACNALVENVSARYNSAFRKIPRVMEVAIGDGARELHSKF